MAESEERDRANVYALLGALLLAPDAELVAQLARLPRSADEDALGECWNGLIAAAQRCGPAALAEHESLFIAAGTPRINPYECWYLDGWLMDKPLARLREDLRALGLARRDGSTELEDHLGALCETMRVLIEDGRPRQVQQAFFEGHLAPWASRCLHDIATAPGVDFYRALAGFAQAFFELESLDVATAT